MRLLDCETSFGALGASLGFSWSLFESSWSLFGGSWMGLGSSSGALGDVINLREPLFSKMSVRLDGRTVFETCTSKNGKRVTEGAYAFAWD